MITILYGSETGNAQEYAEFLSKRLQYHQLRPTISALDDFPLKRLITDTDVLIVVCLTTGQGELPRNAKKFMKFLLKRKLPSDLLNHLAITTFGVGDSLYPQFNYAIKKIHARLLQLGCTELCPRCEADEQSPEGIDGYYTEWELALVSKLVPPLSTPAYNDEDVLPLEHKLVIDESHHDVTVACSAEFTHDGIEGVVVQNKRITASDHFQDVRHIIIESREQLDYRAGDTIALYPNNDDASVELLLQLQPHWLPLADKPVQIDGVAELGGGAAPLTLRLFIKYHLDIMSIPRRSFFLTLWHFCDASTEDGARERDKLREFSTFEDVDELYNYANRPRRLILETILEFQGNLKIPPEYIYDLSPKIKPRLFLIALAAGSSRVEIVVAIVEYRTMLKRIRRGLCTKWLKQKAVGSRLMFLIHQLHLQFPTTAPIVMIAPGTGVAPMRAVIEEQVAAGNRQLYLFFGCRYKAKDCLLDDQWTALQERGQLHYFPVFSRDGSKCKYVQHKLIEHAKLVADLIANGATVFVCGSSGSMPREVRATLTGILSKVAGLADAGNAMLEMERAKKYIQETW
jgi:sulfite reductase alpha subunit-like flavoprotein